jgi:hypothetical protein
MNSTLTIARLMLCAGLAVISTAAAAGVNKCVDQNGDVLYTDVPCPQDSRLIDPTVSDSPQAGVIINSGIERIAPGVQPAVQAPRSRWADLPRPLQRKAIGVDAGTLQTARMNLQMQDELRKQRSIATR